MKFTEEMFNRLKRPEIKSLTFKAAAQYAQEEFDSWINTQMKCTGYIDKRFYLKPSESDDPSKHFFVFHNMDLEDSDTHEGYFVLCKPLEKKYCDHDLDRSYAEKYGEMKCRFCGERAEWSKIK